MKIVDVLIEHQSLSLCTSFSYLCDDKTLIQNGVRVYVPFGYQNIMGYVLNIKHTDLSKEQLEKQNNLKYRYIHSVIDDTPILNDELWDLVNHMSYNYVAPLMSCINTVLPPSYKPTKGNINPTVGKIIKKIVLNTASSENIKLTNKQLQVFNLLVKNNGGYLKDYSRSIVQKLLEQKLIRLEDEEILPDFLDKYNSNKGNKLKLNSYQKEALNKIINDKNDVFLLQGVTGSGKTEIYLNLVDYYLKLGKTAIVLVPEISLTPMTIKRFKQWFDDIAILHGSLSKNEKRVEYEKIKNGKAKVVIGARSAIFAPLKNIGIIILDEEHSTSYKQDKMPCYHAKDIAIYRAKKHNCKVVLGSATPSFETKARALKNVYTSVYLTKRANNHKLPKCTIVNMREDMIEGISAISKTLDQEIKCCLEKNEKIILLQNRRGYSPYVTCRSCGYMFKCPTCEVSMSYHKKSNKFKCHHCNHEVQFDHTCPKCGQNDFLFMGTGTQKIEEIIENLYPNAKILRMDNDTTSKKHGHLEILEKFKNEDYNILLGTQMVAKGLDFHDVTLVGVIDADITLAVADFRSAEFSFELLSQVAGRAGRGQKEGKVIIQTYNPEHYSILYASQHDYESFFKYDMAFRNRRNYPPFSYLSSITLHCEKPENALLMGDIIADYLKENKKFEILGPAFPYIFKEASQYKVRILIKSKKQQEIIETCHKTLNKFKNQLIEKKCNITFDIDTYNLI